MPRSTKRLASSERTLAAPEMVERIRFNRKGGRGKPRGYINQDERLRQQTLTQIDFVSYIPMEEADLNLIEDEEPLKVHLEEDSTKVEQANAKTSAKIALPAVPTTPRKKRKLEIASSHSPPDSPYSPGSRGSPQKSMSPLATRAQQLLSKSSSGLGGTTLDVKLPSALVVGRSIPRGIEDTGDGIPLSLPSLPTCQDISGGTETGSPAAARNALDEAVTFEETDRVTISRIEGDGKPLGERPKKPADALAKTEIRGSDDEDSETDYDFGPETQVVADNMDLAYLSEPLSSDKTSLPKHALEVSPDSASQIPGHTDAEVTKCTNDGIIKAKQVSFTESTTIEFHGEKPGTPSQTCGHPDPDDCGTEDARIQPEGGDEHNHSQDSPLSENHTTGSEGTWHDIDVQSTSILPPAHTESLASRSTSPDIWTDNHTQAGNASEGDYDFELASQLLPESLMNDSLPLPPGFSQEFLDEEDY
jgi:hypothetical protein